MKVINVNSQKGLNVALFSEVATQDVAEDNLNNVTAVYNWYFNPNNTKPMFLQLDKNIKRCSFTSGASS